MIASLNSLDDLKALIAQDSERMRLLNLVSTLNLPDSWIGAGFVRNLVWDTLHGYSVPTPLSDVDVIYFDPTRTDPAMDLEIQNQLSKLDPLLPWQVRNQARMHLKNGDARYTESADAISRWPETATAIAARLTADQTIEVLAPLGIEDLIQLRVRPNPHFMKSPEKLAIYHDRIRQKAWQKQWPKLQMES